MLGGGAQQRTIKRTGGGGTLSKYLHHVFLSLHLFAVITAKIVE